MTTGTLRDLAARPDMPSAPTLRDLMRRYPSFPVLESGRGGVGYLIDLDRAAAFVRAHWGDARRRKAYGSPADDDPQLQLPMMEPDK